LFPNTIFLGTRTLIRTSRSGTFSEEDLDRYREAWSQPGSITAMINWYRALFREMPNVIGMQSRVRVPVRILWGARDRFLLPGMAAASLKYCDNGVEDTLCRQRHSRPRRMRPHRTAGITFYSRRETSQLEAGFGDASCPFLSDTRLIPAASQI
jgi:hypothetical protein